jgi:hypothetical protein
VLAAIDEEALERLRQGPEIRVAMARPPDWTTPGLATALGFFCYMIERQTGNPVHPRLATRVGFRPEVVDARTCRTPEELLELLLASSCTPPAVSIQRPGGRPALDGGLVDNSPVYALGEKPGPTLVLLTRRYPLDRLPRVPGRMYVQPSEPIRIYKWDYTNPEGIQEAFDLGRRDGDRFVELYRSLG